MIIIAGTIDFESREQRDAAVAAGVTKQDATRRDEPGCLAYSFSADSSVETRVQVYECWTDEASLAAHFEHANYFEMRTLLGGFGPIRPKVAKFRCDLSEPVYDDQFRPRADFFTAKD